MGLQRQERGGIESRRFRGDEGVTLYSYGAPSGTGGDGSSSGVTAQWLFDESSGNIVDEINSVTLSANGTPTYSQSLSGLFVNLGPAIDYGAGSGHQLNSANSNLDLGTSDFVFECWIVYATTGGSTYIMDTKAGGDADDEGWSVFYNTAEELVFEMVASDATRVQYFKDGTGYFSAGDTQKIRIAGDRDGNINFFVDGQSLGTTSMSTLSGKSVAASLVHIAQKVTDVFYFVDQIAEIRLTVGNATNNSGGTGGG